ncbi:uncharacterized protein PITG_00810 [Phytophthora infestans T30-4]|uniref:Uncharacterized protein n=1 Tax=Phytophthora infestans (strain T30-4) TaxID=403677 RepID=D0MRR5_PHYIT|nr:uncharacterized protein PITG_00810 [Phytophthora infestans T30-4]EEY58184.1 conserved hypothetical protein [Phytophthora infestans T30-4]|eukprot:XP_002909370.1 conserved hypothetical protein [Phytophthora infestans T30-4]
MRDQGKTARAHGGEGSGFLTQPRGMWEADYRFAVAGRLNQVDTYSVLKRRRLRSHDRCRQPGCHRAETPAHVLNHCPSTIDAVRGRHDGALKRIEPRVNHTCRHSSAPRYGPISSSTTTPRRRWRWSTWPWRLRSRRPQASQVRPHQATPRAPRMEGTPLGARVRVAWGGR